MKHSRPTIAADPAWMVFPELAPPEPQGDEKPIPSIRQRFAARRPSKKSGTSPEHSGHLRATAMSFTDMHSYGDLLVSYLKARKATFIDRMHWNLPQTQGMEFDQYDTPLCRWVVLHEFGEILGGVRLVPTTAQCGQYTYMLRDAQRGILDNIPTDVLFFEAPVEERIWEASRLFISDDVPSHRRHEVQVLLMSKMSETARAEGASQVIGIVPWVFSRWLRRLGLDAVPVGPKFTIDGTSSQSALFNVARYIN